MTPPQWLSFTIIIVLVALPIIFAKKGIVKLINTFLFWPGVIFVFFALLSPLSKAISENSSDTSELVIIITNAVVSFGLAFAFFWIIEKIASLPILKHISKLVGLVLGFLIAYTLTFCSLLAIYYWIPGYYTDVVTQSQIAMTILHQTPIFSQLLVN